MLQILTAWAMGQPPDSSSLKQMERWELEDSERAEAFGITVENVSEMPPARCSESIQTRAHLFHSLLDDHFSLPILPQQLETLWKFWLPFALKLVQDRQQKDRPIIQGILGGQGTGKTTLARVLKHILAHLNYQTLSFSIDDLYKTYPERQQLLERDPRLIWRGPPGTHDVELGIQVLDQLRCPQTGEAIAIPRFDKSLWSGAGDRIQPEWVSHVDIVLLEGWFVGCRPIDETQFDSAPAPILTEADRQFARDMNRNLKTYLPLWERLDQLIILHPVDYRLSKQWRYQAEQEMMASGKSGMSKKQIEQFVDYFWKALHPELFILPLAKNPQLVDLVIEINPNHSVSRIYKPKS